MRLSGQELLHGCLVRAEKSDESRIVVHVGIKGQHVVVGAGTNGFGPKERAQRVVFDHEEIDSARAGNDAGSKVRRIVKDAGRNDGAIRGYGHVLAYLG